MLFRSLTLWILKLASVRQAAKVAAVLWAIAIPCKSLDFYLTDDENSQGYALTSLYHPLNHILYFGKAPLTPEEEALLGKVIPVEELSHFYEPYAMSQFHQGHYTLPIDPADWNRFLKTYVRLSWENRDEFFKERTSMLMGTLNVTPYAFIDLDLLDRKEELSQWPNSLGFSHIESFKSIRTKINNALPEFQTYLLEHPIKRFIFLSPAIFLLLGFWGGMRSSKWRRFYLASLVYFSGRIAVIYLTASQAQMRYYMDITFFSLLIIFLTWDFQKVRWPQLRGRFKKKTT